MPNERPRSLDQLVLDQIIAPDDIAVNDDLYKLVALRVHGVEVTQGIQYYDAASHLSDAADRGPDNSLTLVAAKPAWVRLYLRALIGSLPGVTGTLEVYRRQLGLRWVKVADLAPQAPGAATAPSSAVYAVERGSINSTLNFVIPADKMCGHLKLVAKLTSPGGYAVTKTVYVSATLRQTLSMRIVSVSYAGTDAGGNPLNLPATSLADAQATAGWATTVFPVESTPDIGLTAAVQLTFPLTGNPATTGGCAQSWLNLNVLVAQAKTADGNQPNTFYYGLVPAAVPIGFNSGCASAGVTSGRVGGQITMAHEFGHALGLPHAPCGGVGASANPAYPAYEPYDAAGSPGGSIGEYGLDVNNGNLKSPSSVKDFMGYCNPDWISIYTHQQSIQNPLLQPRSACEDEPWFNDDVLYDPWWWIKNPYIETQVERFDLREQVISVIGTVEIGGKLEIRSTTRAFANPQIQGGKRTGWIAELLGGDGERLAAAPLMRLPTQGRGGCGCGGNGDDEPAIVQAYLPTSRRGECVRVVSGDDEVWRVDAPKRRRVKPKVSATVSEDGRLHARWKVGKRDEHCEVWLRCSHGDGEPVVLTIATGSGSAELDFAQLAPGAATIDAVLQDGFDVVESNRVAIEIPGRRPSAAILHPVGEQTFAEGRALRLHGIASACDGTHVDPESCRFILDGEDLDVGPDNWIPAPRAGQHEVVFVASDDYGEARASVRFQTVAIPEE